MSILMYSKLGDYAEVFSGYAFKSSVFKKSGIPVIKISNIKTGYIDLKDKNTQYVETFYLKKVAKKFIQS